MSRVRRLERGSKGFVEAAVRLTIPTYLLKRVRAACTKYVRNVGSTFNVYVRSSTYEDTYVRTSTM
jgi:hypothetical protein